GEGGWSIGEALPAAGPVAGVVWRKGLSGGQGRRALSPVVVHLLAPHRRPTRDDELRFAEPRRVRLSRSPYEHPHARPPSHERHYVSGVVAEIGRAAHARWPRDRSTAGARPGAEAHRTQNSRNGTRPLP